MTHTSTKQSEAEKLARIYEGGCDIDKRAAAELRRLHAENDLLREVAKQYLDAQDELDNREYHGINAEPYEKLMRNRNFARDDLDAAISAHGITQEKQG